jgi:hypothetical protein
MLMPTMPARRNVSTCSMPKTPIPSSLPRRSCIGLTEVTNTSIMRLVFSSTRPLIRNELVMTDDMINRKPKITGRSVTKNAPFSSNVRLPSCTVTSKFGPRASRSTAS